MIRLKPRRMEWLVIAFCLAAVSSCGESARRSLLTFFFEGVPAPLGEREASRSRAASQDESLSDPEAQAALLWYVHEPVKQCTRCHGDQIQHQFSREVGLVADVPELCYQCHPSVQSHRRWVHEPVAEGDCLWCHEPHRSRHEHLLIEAAPALCYQCHDSGEVEAIDYHDLPHYRHCTDCHAGHTSDTPHLLFAAPVDELTPFALEDYKEALSLAHEDADRGVDFPTLMRRVQDTLDQGDLGRARATLMGIQGSGKVSAPETPGWDRMLRALEAEEARAIEGQDAAGRQRASHLAERYYESAELYHRGDLEGARRGFKEVVDSGLIPEEMQKSLEQSIRRIDEALAPSQGQTPQGGR